MIFMWYYSCYKSVFETSDGEEDAGDGDAANERNINDLFINGEEIERADTNGWWIIVNDLINFILVVLYW